MRFTFSTVLLGEDKFTAQSFEWFVHDHLTLVVVVVLQVYGALLFIKFINSIFNVSNFAVTLANDYSQEIVCAGNHLKIREFKISEV